MSEQYHNKEVGHEANVPHSEAKQHYERVHKNHEKLTEKDRVNTQHEREIARREVQEQAKSAAEHSRPQAEQSKTITPSTRADKLHSFNTVMHHVRQSMTKPEKQFSKFIHQPAVEKASEAIGKTVARPSGIFGASVAAFIGLFFIYSVARFAGFSLSGSEMPILLLIGFLAGVFIEWLIKSIRSLLTSKI